MHATDALVLHPAAHLSAVDRLGASTRSRLEAGDGDYVVGKVRSRKGGLLVDADAANFLRRFTSPKTVVEAVLEHSRGTGVDPQVVLDGVLPLVQRLCGLHLLVTQTAAELELNCAPLPSGTRVHDVELIECVHGFDDVEVYRALCRDGGARAVKMLRAGAPARSLDMLAREAIILGHLKGAGAPLCTSGGTYHGRRYVVQRWVEGMSVASVARGLRNGSVRGPSPKLVALCRRVLEAYVALHRLGVVHGDVHPGNIIVEDGGAVTLIDFGLAVCTGLAGLPPPTGGAVPQYFDPEYCAAVRRGARPSPATALSEQYALGALCFLLMTGGHYLEFALERDRWLEQVIGEPPLPLAARGAEPWPEMEAVLGRALEKEPSRRFPSIADMMAAFDVAASTAATSSPRVRSAARSMGCELLDRIVHDFGIDNHKAAAQSLRAPRCSVNYGAAGIAYFLCRLACLRGDAQLLAAADVWSSWAAAEAKAPGAFHNDQLHIVEEVVGPVSPYHTATGIHATQALISHAMSDSQSSQEALLAFVAAASVPCPNLDLTLGQSGVLTVCALLLEAFSDSGSTRVESLFALGRSIARSLEATLGGCGSMPECTDVSWLGVAHGWAGIIYAMLRWEEASGESAGWVAARLEELADHAQVRDGKASWPYRATTASSEQSPTAWCHGNSGYVHLWLLADAVRGGSRYAHLARQAGAGIWESWDRPAAGREDPGTLCCGSAGKAYALLALHRSTQDEVWLDRARNLTEAAVRVWRRGGMWRGSLYKGDVGVALLVAEIEQPKHARMPLFEDEGWRRGRQGEY
jgi:hypothetical protein